MVVRWRSYWIFFILAGQCQRGVFKDNPAANQLFEYAKSRTKWFPVTSDGGNPLPSITASYSFKNDGLMLMDSTLIETMARAVRESIPPRSAHAKGSGAFGYFEVTHDITQYTKAKLFEKVGKKTPIAVRFSMSGGQYGTAETTRDARGMAIKFYTEEGIWDFTGVTIPVFPFRDPMFIGSLSHALKRNPRTNLRDTVAMFDLFTQRPETIHTVLHYMSDRSLPDGYRHMNVFGVNTFMLINDENEIVYVKFVFKTDQGIRNLSNEKAQTLAATDPDYFTRDLYNAIETGKYPSWTFYIQVMKPEDVPKYPWSPFDPTRVWRHKDYPLIPIGKIVLNRNPINYFAEVEQIAFSPGNFVPGIGPSMDKVLQGRIFVYPDAQRYRLGPNHKQIPVNYPEEGLAVHNYLRDCKMAYFNQRDAPNYYPNSFNGPIPVLSAALPEFNVTGIIKRWDLEDEDNYSQPRIFWNEVLKQDEKERIVDIIVTAAKATYHAMKERMVQYFQPLDEKLAQKLIEELEMDPAVLKSKKTRS